MFLEKFGHFFLNQNIAKGTWNVFTLVSSSMTRHNGTMTLVPSDSRKSPPGFSACHTVLPSGKDGPFNTPKTLWNSPRVLHIFRYLFVNTSWCEYTWKTTGERGWYLPESYELIGKGRGWVCEWEQWWHVEGHVSMDILQTCAMQWLFSIQWSFLHAYLVSISCCSKWDMQNCGASKWAPKVWIGQY